MKNHSITLLTTAFLLVSAMGFAQQDFFLALYKHHMNVFNPATTGTQEGAFLNTSYRSQWVNVADATRGQAISLGFPSGEKRLGYGLRLSNDVTFTERQTKIYTNFSYRLPLNDQWNLYLGLAAGGNNFSVDLNNLDNLETTGDRAFSSYSHFNPNIGVGIYLQSEKYFLSISLPEMLSTKRYKEQNGFSTTPEDLPHFYAIAGAKLPLSSDWSWVGSTLVRYVAAAPWSVVANTGLGYKKLEATVGYQFDAGITGTLLLKTDGVFTLGYSYQAPTAGQLASITGGSHELLLKIRLGSPTPKEETIEEERIGTHNKEIVLGSITNSLFKI